MYGDVAHYEILERLGSGGFGEVFLARDRKLGRRVALKILPGSFQPPALTDEGATLPTQGSDRRERFFREAHAAAALDDPHIITVYEVGDFVGGCFIAMEYVDGVTMKKLLEAGLPSFQEVCDIGVDVCAALAAAHKNGIIHRDIKGENIMRTTDGRVKVLDFGLARDTTAATITRSGDIMGTPAYMPPEQALGEKVDARSDIYSLGVVLYELLTGQLPFGGTNPVAVLYALVNEEPPRPREIRLAIPEQLEKIVLKAMMKEPDRRYATASDLASDLVAFSAYLARWRDEPENVPVLLATEEVYEARRRRFEPEMVGREEEMERVAALLDEAFEGRGRTVMVAGEAGIGKSRLTSEIQQRARMRRAVNLVGRCLYGTGAFPYQPLVEATRRHLASQGVEGSAALNAFVKAEMPELAGQLRALTAFLRFSDEPLEESARREQLWEAYRSFLLLLARRRPVTFLLEDLHWADEPTLALAFYLMSRLTQSRILFLGTYRPEEQKDGGPVEKIAEASQTFSREEWFHTLRLERLDPAAVSHAVRSLFGEQGLGGPIESALAHETGGNPFMLLETLKFLANEGKLVEEDGRWRLAGTWDPSAVPERVLDLVMRRVERLDLNERDLLELAAVQGEHFESDVLSEGLGMNRIRLLKTLQHLEKNHQLIRPTEKGYAFDHATIRRALYESISAELRREYHLTVARVLAARRRIEAGGAAAIAHHFLEGGDEAAAVPHLIAAGRDANRVFANAEARAFLLRALAILDAGAAAAGADPVDAGLECLALLGDVELLTSRHDEALSYYGRMRTIAHGAERPQAEGYAAIGTGLVRYNRAEFAAALASFEEAAERFRAADDRQGAARALDKIGNVHTKQGRTHEALRLHEQALEIRRAVGDRVGEAESLNNIAIVYRNWGRLDDALAAQERALAIKREMGERRGVATSLINMGNVLFLLRRRAEALERYTEALRICSEIGDRRLMAYPLSSMGNTFFENDDYDAALEHYRLALGIYEEIGDRWGAGRALNNLAVIELRRASFAEARESLARSLALKRMVDDARSRADTLINLGEVHRRLGHLQEAAEAFAEAARTAEESDDAALRARARLGMAAIAFERGEADAEPLLRDARERAAASGIAEAEVSAGALLARILASRDPAEALACAERAFARATEAGAAYDRAAAGCRLGHVRSAAGCDPGAEFQEARGIAASLRFREVLCEGYRVETMLHLAAGRADDAVRGAERGLRVLDEIVDLAPEDAHASYLARGEVRSLLDAAARAYEAAGRKEEAARIAARARRPEPSRKAV